MQNNQLDRLLKLINRTGDRLVVLDKESETAVVMMEIEEYEKILGGGPRLEDMSESDILDRINREVAAWREKNVANSTISDHDDFVAPKPVEVVDLPEIDEAEDEDEIADVFAEVSQKDVKKAEEAPITVNPIVGPEEELKDVPNDGEEERFYLEPV